MTSDIVIIRWQNLLLYPSGYYVRDLPVRATLTLPSAFHQATSLEPAQNSSDITEYKPTTIERRADSPVSAGRYFKAIGLNAARSTRVTLDLSSDSPGDLSVSDSQLSRKLTGVYEPNVTGWRRHTFGDLTSAFRLRERRSKPPLLPDTNGTLNLARYAAANLPLPPLPTDSQQPPSQEKGRRSRVPTVVCRRRNHLAIVIADCHHAIQILRHSQLFRPIASPHIKSEGACYPLSPSAGRPLSKQVEILALRCHFHGGAGSVTYEFPPKTNPPHVVSQSLQSHPLNSPKFPSSNLPTFLSAIPSST